MPEKKWKLNYKIVGRRSETVNDNEGKPISMEHVDIEWTHDDGPIQDTCLLPINHAPIHPSMPPIEYKEVVTGTRDVIKDMVTVKNGTPDFIIFQMMEDKRLRLAANLKIEP